LQYSNYKLITTAQSSVEAEACPLIYSDLVALHNGFTRSVPYSSQINYVKV